MQYTYKQEFIRFMVSNGVLKFGEFTLKSGRIAPYFINTGNYKTGKQLAKLGEYYAACIEENGLNAWCDKHNIKNVSELTGTLQLNG